MSNLRNIDEYVGVSIVVVATEYVFIAAIILLFPLQDDSYLLDNRHTMTAGICTSSHHLCVDYGDCCPASSCYYEG